MTRKEAFKPYVRMDDALVVQRYRGVDVCAQIGSNAITFTGKVGTRVYRGGSFETLKKKLDAAISFEPFPALEVDYRKGEIVAVTVRGIERNSRGDLCYLVEAPNDRTGEDTAPTQTRLRDPWAELYPPEAHDAIVENLAKLTRWDEAEARIEAEREEQRNAMNELRIMRAENFGSDAPEGEGDCAMAAARSAP